MMKENKRMLSLYRPVTYEIKVPGYLDERWSEYAENMTIAVESDDDGMPISTLTGTVDQAALLGLLRRLYSMGLPLISVYWVDFG